MSRRVLIENINSDTLSEKTLSRFERGERFPSAKTVSKIARAFGMSAKELLDTLAERSSERSS